MIPLAVIFAVSAVVLCVAVCRAHRRLAVAAATFCAVTYAGSLVLLILGSLRV